MAFIHGLAVVSADGFIARNRVDLPASWASAQDQQHLQKTLDGAGVCIMGRTTHELFPNHKGRQRLVLTHQVHGLHPQDEITTLYNADGATLPDFRKTVQSLTRGKPAMVLGGQPVYEKFFAAHMFDRFDLTVEGAVQFGEGIGLLKVPLQMDALKAQMAGYGLMLAEWNELNAPAGTELWQFVRRP